MSSTPSTPRASRVTRSMSAKPEPGADADAGPSPVPPSHVDASATVPGPPVAPRSTSLAAPNGTATWHGSGAVCNPFHVDLVVPYDISLSGKKERREEIAEIREGYEALIRALEGEGGLRVGTKVPPGPPGPKKGRGKGEGKEEGEQKGEGVGKGKGRGKGEEEVWVFVGVGEDKMRELVEREQ